MQEKIVQVREQKTKEEKMEVIEKEKNRVKNGKEAQVAKKAWEQKQRERDEMLKRKEREEEKRAKEKIKMKLEQDKAERGAAKKATEVNAAPQVVQEAAPVAKKEYTEALIQVRLKDNTVIKATFKPTDPIRTVHNHIELLTGSPNFSLATTFPRKVYSPRDSSMDTTTLAQAELVPTGTFIVQ